MSRSRIDIDVIEGQRGGVAQADAVLVFGLVVSKTLRVFFDDEPGWTAGRVCQHCICAGDSTVADPLLVAVNFVAHDASVLKDAIGRGAQGSQIAAGFRLGGAVGKQQSLIGDAAQPELLLLVGGADRDGIAAEKSSQHGGRNPEIDPRHLLANAVDVERATAHAAELFGNKQKLNTQLVGAAHVTDDFDGAFVAVVEIDQNFVGQALPGEFFERLQTQLQCLGCKHGFNLTWR